MAETLRPFGTILLTGAFLTAGLAGLVAFRGALPSNSSTSPLMALAAFGFGSTSVTTAVLTWRRSRFAAFAFVAAIGLLLFPARFLVPTGQIFVPAFWVLTTVASIGFLYLRRVRDGRTVQSRGLPAR